MEIIMSSLLVAGLMLLCRLLIWSNKELYEFNTYTDFLEKFGPGNKMWNGFTLTAFYICKITKIFALQR